VLADAGRFDHSVAAYRDALARLEELGMHSFRSTTLINFGETLYLRGEADEAEKLAIEGEELGASEDVVNFALGRALRARVAADRFEHADAERLAREALENAYKTDFPSVHATAHEALAHAHAASGRIEEARAELEQALELWSRYGFQVDADRVRARLVKLSSTP
jgi:tetratricopeptide (TPR) repeat protein